MKCTIPEISWHNREPVFSVDVFPENGLFYRLASGGGDCHVLIWQMTIASNGAVNQDLISDLTRHQRSVNCVRWSNSGKYLASGDDDANIIVWQLKTDNIPLLEGDTGDRETWNIYKVMRGHKEDIYDICWSIDGSKLLSGSVDNTAILWDLNKGKMDHILTDHKGFVQGVAWDPKNQIIATISTDRVCRIFDNLGKHVKARIQKGKITAVPDGHFFKDKDVKYFHDDTFKSFFRRLQFTPDGSLLIVPSGYIEADNCKTALNATLIFTIDNLSSPAVILPIPRQSSTVVRCCPLLFQLKEDGPDSTIKLPYRMIFAVGTDHDIILYDTQQKLPFARFQDIHYTRVTDLTWSQDGLLLIASSTDGFCSLITFEIDELGIPWVKTESEREEPILEMNGCHELVEKDENIDMSNKEIKTVENSGVNKDLKEQSKKRPSFLEQWALKTPKKRKIADVNTKEVSGSETRDQVICVSDSPIKTDVHQQSSQEIDVIVIEESVKRSLNDQNSSNMTNTVVDQIKTSTPRRIKPIRMESKPGTCKTDTKTVQPGIGIIAEDLSHDIDSSNSEEELSQVEQEELAKASHDIQNFFCRQPKQAVDQSNITKAKPIAVRRKPANEGKVDIQSSISVPKPIAVRRKPRVLEQKKGQVEKVSDQVKSNSFNASKVEGTLKCSVIDQNPQKITAEGKVKSDSTEKKSNTKSSAGTNKNPVDVICLDSDEECNITPKTDKAVKPFSQKFKKSGKDLQINISSFGKNKTPEVTPKKSKNALLSFLQKSSEKAKKKKIDNTESHTVIPIEEEEVSARDAWSCHVTKEENRLAQNKDENIMLTDDDKTEDFCLQLEESQDCEENTCKSQNCDDKYLEKADSTDKEKSKTLEEPQCSTSKTPRRVPLITLCSPGRKSKK